MDTEQKIVLLNSSLERTAEMLGDITPDVMQRYYSRYPEARKCFDQHCLGERGKLEGEMVEQTIYCLMEWFGCPGEIEIVLMTTIPHHAETLKVPLQYFAGLLDAVCETVIDTVPATNTEELAVWKELKAIMRALVENEGVFA